MNMISSTGVAVLTLLAATPAWAHIAFSPQNVEPGYAGPMQLQVSHGCGEEATESITLFVPVGVKVMPEDKVGWQVGSTESNGQVSMIRWFGHQLPSAERGEFTFNLMAPTTPGVVAMAVRQECTIGVQEWADPEPESAFPMPRFSVDSAQATVDEGV